MNFANNNKIPEEPSRICPSTREALIMSDGIVCVCVPGARPQRAVANVKD